MVDRIWGGLILRVACVRGSIPPNKKAPPNENIKKIIANNNSVDIKYKEKAMIYNIDPTIKQNTIILILPFLSVLYFLSPSLPKNGPEGTWLPKTIIKKIVDKCELSP